MTTLLDKIQDRLDSAGLDLTVLIRDAVYKAYCEGWQDGTHADVCDNPTAELNRLNEAWNKSEASLFSKF